MANYIDQWGNQHRDDYTFVGGDGLTHWSKYVDTASSPGVIGLPVITVSRPVVGEKSPISLRYRGKNVTAQTNDLAIKSFVDIESTNSAVTKDWLDEQINLNRSNKIPESDVTAMINSLDSTGKPVYIRKLPDPQRPAISDLNTELAKYVDATRLGAANGMAKADGFGVLPSTQWPTNLKRDNVPVFYDVVAQWSTTSPSGLPYGTNNFGASSVSIGNSDFAAMTFTIPDPGYLYYPLNFVYIQGKPSGSPAATRQQGNSQSTGKIVVAEQLPSSTPRYYARGICNDVPYTNYYVALPDSLSGGGTNTTTVTPCRGSTKLYLYLSAESGSNSYIFYSAGLMWNIMVLPVVGN